MFLPSRDQHQSTKPCNGPSPEEFVHKVDVEIVEHENGNTSLFDGFRRYTKHSSMHNWTWWICVIRHNRRGYAKDKFGCPGKIKMYDTGEAIRMVEHDCELTEYKENELNVEYNKVSHKPLSILVDAY